MKRWVYIFLILALFLGVQCLLPLRSAIQIGADEGYELAKATLSIQGFKMYTEVWNDQPPLHTYLISEVLKHLTPSVLGTRLVTTAFVCVLLTAVFFICLRLKGLLVAVLASLILLATPVFLELGASCMVEIPAMAPALAGIWILLSRDVDGDSKGWVQRWRVREVLAGVLFGVAFQIKFINLVLLPLVALILWLRARGMARAVRSWIFSGVAMAAACGVAFVAINQWTDGQGFLVQFRQSWEAHFASAKSLEYGSPADHPFDWRALIKNWDACVPALLGVFVCLREVLKWRATRRRGLAEGGRGEDLRSQKTDSAEGRWRNQKLKDVSARRPYQEKDVAEERPYLWALVPVVWLGVNLFVFAVHKPWWSCYYLHIAVPLSVCAGIGVAWGWERVRGGGQRLIDFCIPARRRRSGALQGNVGRGKTGLAVLFGVFALAAVSWMVGRVYLEVQTIRNCPRIYTCLFLEDIERYKPFTKFIYTEEPVYSFHTGIPMPPKFAVVALKRLWSGDMTNEKIHNEMWTIKPGIILLQNGSRQMPFADLLAAEYKPVYQDDKHRLYVHKDVIAKERQRASDPDARNDATN